MASTSMSSLPTEADRPLRSPACPAGALDCSQASTRRISDPRSAQEGARMICGGSRTTSGANSSDSDQCSSNRAHRLAAENHPILLLPDAENSPPRGEAW